MCSVSASAGTAIAALLPVQQQAALCACCCLAHGGAEPRSHVLPWTSEGAYTVMVGLGISGKAPVAGGGAAPSCTAWKRGSMGGSIRGSMGQHRTGKPKACSGCVCRHATALQEAAQGQQPSTPAHARMAAIRRPRPCNTTQHVAALYHIPAQAQHGCTGTTSCCQRQHETLVLTASSVLRPSCSGAVPFSVIPQ